MHCLEGTHSILKKIITGVMWTDLHFHYNISGKKMYHFILMFYYTNMAKLDKHASKVILKPSSTTVVVHSILSQITLLNAFIYLLSFIFTLMHSVVRFVETIAE